MLTILLNALGTLLAGLAKAWFEQQSLAHETEQAGVEQEAANVEEQANVKVSKAEQARNAIVPITAGELPAHNSTNDPDFRD